MESTTNTLMVVWDGSSRSPSCCWMAPKIVTLGMPSGSVVEFAHAPAMLGENRETALIELGESRGWGGGRGAIRAMGGSGGFELGAALRDDDL